MTDAPTPSVLAVRTNERLGWRPDVPDYRDYAYGSKLALEVAKAQDIDVNKRLESRLLRGLPVIDQEQSGSCVGQCIATLHAAVRRVTQRSGLQVYYEARRMIGEVDRDEGAYIRDGIKVIANLGAGRETWWPMKMDNVLVDPPLKVDRDALRRRIFSYYRLAGMGEWDQAPAEVAAREYQACLAAGYPFVIGIALFSSFMGHHTRSTGVAYWPRSSDSFIGGHAVCVWGYEPNFRDTDWAADAGLAGVPLERIPERAYLVRNSWGKDWGREGNFAIDAKYLEHPHLADDAWTIRKVAQPSA